MNLSKIPKIPNNTTRKKQRPIIPNYINHKKKQRTYKKNDFNSNDGMLTMVWGPSVWHFLHTISFNYPVNPNHQDKIKYRRFILSLVDVLPCKKCRMNLKKNFQKMPLKMAAMNSRATFSRYIYDLHEHINKMLHKVSGLSYEDVQERYEHFRARCIVSPENISKVLPTTISPQIAPENGCVEPLYGEKAKCELHIVPADRKSKTMQIDPKCIKHRLYQK
jgi:hypothetical protein